MTCWKAGRGRLRRCAYLLASAVVAAACAWFFSAPGGAALHAEEEGRSASPNLVEVSNQYIKVFVNATDDGTGRFAVDSTGGDPLNPADDNKPLIYGRPCPWTSYTTVKVDGVDYVFGGKTERRAGREGYYGTKVLGPTLSGGNIIAAWNFGDIEVSQVLSIVRSTTTGLFDTAKITYIVSNHGLTPHNVGLRVMLDTMLGANDGAPFRVKDKAVVSDTVFGPNDMPHFWQAFDSLSSPSVTSQGTVAGPEVTPPDRVVFTNWGSLADGVWDSDFSPGRDFTRSGEYELDSAIALFWDPVPLAPGDSKEYTTLYGMGGISIAPGVLSVGVTSPAEVTCAKDRPITFPVVAYVENSGPTVALGVRITIALPSGLRLAPGEKSGRVLGNLEPGETAQAAWDLTPDVVDQAELEYSVVVEAENAEPNRVARSVRVLAPPNLLVRVEAPPGFEVKDDAFDPYPLGVKAVIENVGGAPAYGVKATLTLGQGVKLAQRETASRFPGTLAPGETFGVLWQIVPSGGAGDSDYVVKVESRSTDERFATGTVRVPKLPSRVMVNVPAASLSAGDFFTVDVVARNVPGLMESQFDVRFDPAVLEAVFVSRGTAFVEDNGMAFWREGVIDNSKGVVKGILGRFTKARDVTGVLATVSFRAKAPGTSRVWLENTSLVGDDGVPVPGSIESASVTVK
ncbi:MAG TPA: cellulosome anchor protein [Firmicutes bacterium]|nr:cellulosome anchor protein [Bacillota bacterium]